MSEKANILVVSSEPHTRELLLNALKEEDYSFGLVPDSYEALTKIKKEKFEVVITNLPYVNNIEILKATKKITPKTKVIILTKFTTIETTLKLIKQGAYDYLKEPFVIDELKILIRRALREKEHYVEDKFINQKLKPKDHFGELIGKSEVMEKVFSRIKDVAKTDITVLIQGETGTGKELVASAIHKLSRRKNKPFLQINCAALTESLLESELFGYEKGAFTGAVNTKLGIFCAADKGTLFLDEISETSPSVQAKILQVMEHKEFLPVGGTKLTKVDVRLITATNKNLKKSIEEGKFRKDLYYRLNVFPIFIPPLRERREDIPLFIYYFLREHNHFLNKHIKGISEDALECLLKYSWPGNVRELENILLQVVTSCKKAVINVDDLPEYLRLLKTSSKESASYVLSFKKAKQETIESFEKKYLKNILSKYKGNVSRAAKAAQITRPFFYEKIKKYGLAPKELRK